MPDSPTNVPLWLWKTAAYLVGGVLTIMVTVLGWVGKRYVSKRDEQIRELRKKMRAEHDEVGSEVDKVRRKIDRTEQKVDRLLEKIDA